MNWTLAQVEAHNRRIARHSTPIPDDAVEREADLHSQIIAECRHRRWQYLHGSMAAETHRTLGEPDFVIMADRGRVFFVECKSRNGKLSPAQLAFKVQAELNGHTVWIVRSMQEFLTVVQ